MKTQTVFLSFLCFYAATTTAAQLAATITCDSAYSPIHFAKGDKIKIQIHKNPLQIQVLGNDGKVINSSGQGKIDDSEFDKNLYTCAEDISISSNEIKTKYSCETNFLPEGNQLTFNQELLLNSNGSVFKGQIQTFETGSSIGRTTLYLWDCLQVTR